LRRTFSSDLIASWPDGIKEFLQKEQITQPTLIQEKTLSIALEDKDLVGVARTGSGKTLAFVIPAIMKILKGRESKGTEGGTSSIVSDHNPENKAYTNRYANGTYKPPKCLVLAPTRELATQTNNVFDKFRFMGVKSIPLVGGSSRSEQVRALARENIDVYVATPGRLMDLMDTKSVDLSEIEYLVLDEADRMLDMGFEPQIRRIISSLPSKRQTLMWSATWPTEIQSLAAEFMRDYEYIGVDSEKLKANPNIKQVIIPCRNNEKLKLMMDHLEKFKEEVEFPKVLVFVNTKRLADSLLLQLMRNRIKAIAMHGDRSQRQREEALRLFRNKICQVMVATDVAARGLDIDSITHVINFDFPTTIEDYIHRIGRTARHERSGTALTLFTENDANMAKKLTQVLRETGQNIPSELAEYEQMHHMYRSNTRGTRKRRDDYFSGDRRGRSDELYGRDRMDRGSRYNDRQPPRNPFRDDEDDYDFDSYDSRSRRRTNFGSFFNDG